MGGLVAIGGVRDELPCEVTAHLMDLALEVRSASTIIAVVAR